MAVGRTSGPAPEALPAFRQKSVGISLGRAVKKSLEPELVLFLAVLLVASSYLVCRVMRNSETQSKKVAAKDYVPTDLGHVEWVASVVQPAPWLFGRFHFRQRREEVSG